MTKNMMFTKIDIEKWNRRRLYSVFTTTDPTFFSLTHTLDISTFLPKTKAQKEKFFPKLLFGICTVLNRHKEFKGGLNEQNEPGYYDVIHPCYTVFHPHEEIITLLCTEFHKDFSVFTENYRHDMALYGDKPFAPKELSIKNFFHISNMPWLSFNAVTLTCQRHHEQFAPMFTIGKYAQVKERISLPLAIHANHAFIDGFHVARFFHELQEWLDE